MYSQRLKYNTALYYKINIFLYLSAVKKHKKLSLDFIGGQQPLTKEEAKAISEYLKTVKASKKRLLIKLLFLNVTK